MDLNGNFRVKIRTIWDVSAVPGRLSDGLVLGLGRLGLSEQYPGGKGS